MANPLLALTPTIGYGAVQLTGAFPWGPAPDRDASIQLLRRAVELGVRLFDTADAYGVGHNEELLGEAFAPLSAVDRENITVATKVGNLRPSQGEWIPCGRPEYLRQQVELSLLRLRVERIDLMQIHRLDTAVPLEDQVGALAELRDQGKIGLIGLSQVSRDQLDQARAVTPIASIQNKYSLAQQGDATLADACAEIEIAFLPWWPLEIDDATRPHAQAVADRHGATLQQVALAWLLRHPNLIPIPGTKNIDHLESNLAALDLQLSDDDLASLNTHTHL